MQVFHHGNDRTVLLVGAEDDGVDILHARHLARAQPALPRNQLKRVVARLAHADGLQQPVLFDRSAKLLQRLLGEHASGLVGIGTNCIDGNARNLSLAHPEISAIGGALGLHIIHSISDVSHETNRYVEDLCLHYTKKAPVVNQNRTTGVDRKRQKASKTVDKTGK